MEATRRHGLLSRKRSFDDGGYVYQDDPTNIFGKRRRSRSLSSGDEIMSLDLDHSLFPRMRPPPTAYELDRINHHMGLEDFGFELGKAANAIFPNNKATRYRRVDVILLSWEKEDPELPVSIEINELADIFVDIYGFEVEKWLIPSEQSHNQLQKRVLEFLGDNDPEVLKIVYYAGHGKLTNHGQLAWTSILDSRKDRCPTAKWSGIQNTLEESQSDVLILLDCCASGICTTDEGNGVTELIAACPHNAKANGVGRFSFTHALILKLKALAPLPHFTVGYLYNTIFTEIQGWRNEDSRHKMVPIHLVLSQNNDRPRSIQLSKFTRSDIHPESSFRGPGPEEFHFTPSVTQGIGQACSSTGSEAKQTSPSDLGQAANDTSGRSTSQHSPATSMSPVPEYPRLLFSIRLNENVKPCDLSAGLFSEWLRDIPTSVSMVTVEAGFASDSTLVIFSTPASILAYLPAHPAILLLGTIRSRNIMAQDSTDDHPMEQCVSLEEDLRFPSPFNKTGSNSNRSLAQEDFYAQTSQFQQAGRTEWLPMSYPNQEPLQASCTPYEMENMPSPVQNQLQNPQPNYIWQPRRVYPLMLGDQPLGESLRYTPVNEQDPTFQTLSHSAVLASGNYMPRASDINNHLLLLRQLDYDAVQEPGIIPSFLLQPGLRFAYMTPDMQIIKATVGFLEVAGMGLTKSLFDIISPESVTKLCYLQVAFEDAIRRDTIVEDEATQTIGSSPSEFRSLGVRHEETITFQPPGTNEEKTFLVRFRLTKTGTIYLVIATFL